MRQFYRWTVAALAALTLAACEPTTTGLISTSVNDAVASPANCVVEHQKCDFATDYVSTATISWQLTFRDADNPDSTVFPPTNVQHATLHADRYTAKQKDSVLAFHSVANQEWNAIRFDAEWPGEYAAYWGDEVPSDAEDYVHFTHAKMRVLDRVFTSDGFCTFNPVDSATLKPIDGVVAIDTGHLRYGSEDYPATQRLTWLRSC